MSFAKVAKLAVVEVYKNVTRCNVCGNLKSINSNCMCSTKKYNQICVVENIADMWVIESTGIYKGHYHVLGGTLPAFENKNIQNGLLIDSLVTRVKKNSVKEVILATSASVEGETTAHYISDSLKDTKVKITRLAKGVPVGGEIEFLDGNYQETRNQYSIYAYYAPNWSSYDRLIGVGKSTSNALN